jgi:hypothetical protein
MDSDRDERLTRMRESAEISGRQGEAWLEKLKPELDHLPNGTVVVINCATGEFVIAKTHLDALHQFKRKFGNAAGWMHEIGGGFFVGGGIV